MTEAELRDSLAQNIEVLEHGLTLLKKEQYIPNPLGTRGFIDLYARDQSGHHVLIELKRSDASARDAIHEIHKYAEGVKSHFGARDDEIRIIVASTEWRELLVPFSSLANQTYLALSGIELKVDTTTLKISAAPITPLPMNKGRLIAPWHELNFYENQENLDRGLLEYEQSCNIKGISDYVVAILRASPAYNDIAREQLRSGLKQLQDELSLYNDSIDIKNCEKLLPDYNYIAYFATHMLTPIVCLNAISKEPERLAELQELIAEMDEEEKLCKLHESIYELDPTPYRDRYEIGYPAKFSSRLLDKENWEISEIKRYGIFSRNSLLSDESIISELRGENGTTGQRFVRKVQISSRAHSSSLKTDVQQCLKDNPVWSAHLAKILSEIEVEFPEAEIDVRIFNPSAGLITLYLSLCKEDGILYIPSYSILVTQNGEEIRFYYGCLIPDGNALEFEEVIRKYYDSDLNMLLLSLTWGGYERRDTEILEDIGLVYRSFQIDLTLASDNNYCLALKDERWRNFPRMDPANWLNQYCNDHLMLVIKTICGIAPLRQFEGPFRSINIRRFLYQISDFERGNLLQQYWSGDASCDLCQSSLSKEIFLIDGALRSGGGWALMCPDCFSQIGRGIGWGSGQLYLRTTRGWLEVAGFQDSECICNPFMSN